MPFQVLRATPKDRDLVQRVAQMWAHEQCEHSPAEPDQDFLFPTPAWAELPDGTGPDSVYIFTLKSKPIGIFAVRDEQEMSTRFDFRLLSLFVAIPYRRLGLGEEAARQAFEQNPGRWHIRVNKGNEPGVRFCRTVLRRYLLKTAQEYTDQENTVVFEFSSATKSES